MHVWTRSIGIPVITVAEDAAPSSVTLTQCRFLHTNNLDAEEDASIHPIPLALKNLKSGTTQNIMFANRVQTITVEDGVGFYKLNTEHVGLYRTSYPRKRLDKLCHFAATHPDLLSAEDRAG